ncbi:hypothetical protein [Chitiniphilus eburneus]|uniref:Uncharacterized protein n=1 Tax=Chitiniphilus eburneus TaxID=2571148 RepID=A0A4U0PNP8_9NEIS|nr:hypothetical protein [Chitiniphilus eburneus]TJZ64604.1 hypothetical protein FAZ21_18960 [Chitiniphilus eburneus]
MYTHRPLSWLMAAALTLAGASFAAPTQRDLQTDPRRSDSNRIDRERDSDPDDRTPSALRASEPTARTSSIAELAR